MTKPNDMITITNDDIEISLPISALQYYDKVVELAHLVILGDAVPERAGSTTIGSEVVDKLKEAMASGNPLEALRKMRDGVQPEAPDRKDLKAEVIEKGEKPKDDPMVRIAEVAMKCAESIGMNVTSSTPVVQIIPQMARMVTEAESQLEKLDELSRKMLFVVDVIPAGELGFSGASKNLLQLGKGLETQINACNGGWKAVHVLRGTLQSLGITVRGRPQGSLEQCIQDCQEALSLAARRGVTLKSGPDGVKG